MEPATKILVVGATGRTGSATISALASLPCAPAAAILALTRSPSSPKAQSRVPHVVLSSVHRGGDEASWGNPTAVPHFTAKHRAELYLRDRTRGTATRWTILRPTGFLDNYGPPSSAGTLMGPLVAGLWATMPPGRTMQLVSARDIGLFAARALADGPGGEWAHRALGLAGDDISLTEADEVFRRVVGRAMPRTWAGVGTVVRWAFEDAGRSMEWFETEGYKADVGRLREMEPRLQTWETWLRESSGWVKGGTEDGE
ncbi:hypothetical protein CTA2_8850 [Colletotrichum tanaceti]|uniref:NmrA-like domain-containing protein n=1 Tax=Colletotrichum tanaceti TaxID=1306861 RepID=A0A4U6XMX6_9PEZI|nr:hypothetical protein CTA2_8850 [Colletotrichum tanaceti]TKW57059.1 hypothetical protein CTA1_5403 [Colletotrichum tanaceti]